MHDRRTFSARLLALLFVVCAWADASEILVPGYPSLSDPYELGARSTVILFLKEKRIAYQAGASDERLLELYRGFWDAQRRAAEPPPPPQAKPDLATESSADAERENLELQLKREYRYVNTAGKDLDELRRVLADLRRREIHQETVAAPPAPATAHPATVTEATRPAGGEPERSPTAAAKMKPPDTAPAPMPLPPVNPRNQGLRSVAELQAAAAAGDMEAHLQLIRRNLYGLQMRQDQKSLHLLTFAMSQSTDGRTLLDEQAAQGDEVAEYVLWLILPSVEQGTAPDDPKAVALVAAKERWLHAAAEHGLPAALYSLSSLLYQGTSFTPADPERSGRLEKQAADAGCMSAIDALMYHPKLTKEERSRYQRMKASLLARSGERDDPEIVIRMAHESGESSDNEFTQQLHYLAAIQGSVHSQFLLGLDAKSPNPTVEQDAMVRYWLGAAALRGHRNAMIIFAEWLIRTPHNPPDPVVPYTWLIRAAGGSRPTGPEYEKIEARISPAQLEIAFADARAWSPIPESTPLIVPPECVVKPPAAMGRWPDLSPPVPKR